VVRYFASRSNFAADSYGEREIVAGLVGKFWRPEFGLIVVNGSSEFLACNPPTTAKLAIDLSPNDSERSPSSSRQKRVFTVRTVTR
jgi:hypothetical protein